MRAVVVAISQIVRLLTVVGMLVAGVALVGGAGRALAAIEATRAAAPAAAAPATESLDLRVEEEARVVEADFGALLLELRQQLRVAVASGRSFGSDLSQALARDAYADGSGWLFEAIASGLAAIVAGLVIAIPVERFILGHLRRRAPVGPSSEQRITHRLLETLIHLLGIVVLTIIGFAVIEILDTGVDVRHRTALLLLVVFAVARGMVLIVRAVVTPSLPQFALPDISETEALRLRRSLNLFIVAGMAILAIDWWLAILALTPMSRHLAAILLSLVLVVLLSAAAVANRRAIPRAFGVTPGADRSAASMLASAWWIIAIIYFVVAWIVRAVHVLLGLPGTSGLVVAPVLLVFGGLVAYGVLHLAVGRLVRPSPVLWIGGPGGVRMDDYRDLAHKSAAIIVVLAAFIALAHIWGAPIIGTGFGASLIKVAAICVVGFIIYDGVRIAIDRKHGEEGGIPNLVAEDEEFAPLPPGQSRLATLLPLARVFVLSAILAVIVMMVLSALGVDVVPLFAGASIFGLAIGFGSQTLVHDVMSGAFFLVDDAFRVGEYVDLGGGSKGTVEKISIRSFQLRHQNGPLHTIPFGGIKQVTNLSRDWAITKLPFSFPHGTDVEKVRKLIKKVGTDLQADAALGPMFLQPMKSQGVVSMDSTSMTFAVKFMTRPNDASMVKRAVYARLSQAFIDAGLEFASSTVTVRIAGDVERPLSEEAKQAVAAAAAQQVLAPPPAAS